MGTTLTIRNLDEAIKHKVRLLAAQHQRSMEAEVRDILARAVDAVPPMAPLSGQVRGRWQGRMTTDGHLALTRGDD